jgi:hypothetical protein
MQTAFGDKTKRNLTYAKPLNLYQWLLGVMLSLFKKPINGPPFYNAECGFQTFFAENGQLGLDYSYILPGLDK